MAMSQAAGRTRRSEDGGYATGGAVRQDGTLPIYICNTCNQQVVWATSRKTGRKYLVTVTYGYLNQRFYAKTNLHHCQTEATVSDERAAAEADLAAAYAMRAEVRSAEQRAMGDD